MTMHYPGRSPPGYGGAFESFNPSSNLTQLRPLRKSCRFCRTRKIRCNGNHSGCAACITRTQDCVYEPISNMGRPRKYPRTGHGVSTSERSTGVAYTMTSDGTHQTWVPNGGLGMYIGTLSPPQPTWERFNLPQSETYNPTPASDTVSSSSQSSSEGLGPSSRNGVPHPETTDYYGAPSIDRRTTERHMMRHPVSLRRQSSVPSPPSRTSGLLVDYPQSPLSPVFESFTPPSRHDLRLDLAGTFQRFVNQPVNSMAWAFFGLLKGVFRGETTSEPALMSPHPPGRPLSNPANTQAYYLSSFHEHGVEARVQSTFSPPRFTDWGFYSGLMADTVSLATSGKPSAEDWHNPAAAPAEPTFLRMIINDRGGDFVNVDGLDSASPLSEVGFHTLYHIFVSWYAASPLAFLINDALFIEQLRDGIYDPALMACIFGWVKHTPAQVGEYRRRGQEREPQISVGALFEYAERELLRRNVDANGDGDEQGISSTLNTVLGLILVAAYRAEKLQTRISWALFSVAHGIARESVKKSQEQSGGPKGPVQEALEENVLSCCWTMALFTTWCFLSCRLPKQSVLEVIDNLPHLPTSASKSASCKLRNERHLRLQQCDHALEFGIKFHTECSLVLNLIATLWGKDTRLPVALVHDHAAVGGQFDPSRWGCALIDDPQLVGNGTFDGITANRLVQIASQFTANPEHRVAYQAEGDGPRHSPVLAIVYATMALNRIAAFDRSRSSGLPVASGPHRIAIRAISILMAESALSAELLNCSRQSIAADVSLAPDHAFILRVCRDSFPFAVTMLRFIVRQAMKSADYYQMITSERNHVTLIIDRMMELAQVGVTLVPAEDLATVKELHAMVFGALLPQSPDIHRSISSPAGSETSPGRQPINRRLPSQRRTSYPAATEEVYASYNVSSVPHFASTSLRFSPSREPLGDPRFSTSHEPYSAASPGAYDPAHLASSFVTTSQSPPALSRGPPSPYAGSFVAMQSNGSTMTGKSPV